MQNLNMRSTAQRQQLQEKRAHALKQYQGACEIALHAYSLRIPFVIELSEKCQGWNLEPFLNLQKKVECVSGVCKGCQVGLCDHKGKLLSKGWRLCGIPHSSYDLEVFE